MTRIGRRLARSRGSLVRLSPLIGRRRGTLIAIVVSATGVGVAEAGVLALVAHVAAAISTGSEVPFVRFGPIDLQVPIPVLLGLAGFLALLHLTLQTVVARLPARLSGEVQSQLRRSLFSSFLDASWTEKAKEREGHLQELMGGQALQAGNAVLHLGNGLSALLALLILGASAFILSPAVAAGVITTSAVLFASLRSLSRRVRRLSKATSSSSVVQASGVAESVRMAEEIEAFGVRESERSRISSLVESLREHWVRTRSLSAVVPVLYQGAVIFLLVGGLGLLYGMGTGRFAALGAVILLLVRASSYGQRLVTAYQSLGESLPYLDRVSSAVERFRAAGRSPGRRTIDRIRTIQFEGVSFSYEPAIPVLRDLNFSIQANEIIGVVGPTGGGKSTLLQLLLRLREPSTGDYRVNGIAAHEIDGDIWHRKVAFLPQEPHLLNASVAENIRFYRDELDEHALEMAARLAHIHEDVVSRPDGYQTVVGQRADAVSGGQRQRLCLARALAGAPELLILDEPTSSLDPQSERLIQESLEGLRGDLTVIVVAHRVSTLSLCDRVMVIREGRLEAFGPIGHLYDSNEFYRRAVDLSIASGSP